jgi:hypothetical protein
MKKNENLNNNNNDNKKGIKISTGRHETRRGRGIRYGDSVPKCNVLQVTGCLRNVFRPDPRTDESVSISGVLIMTASG